MIGAATSRASLGKAATSERYWMDSFKHLPCGRDCACRSDDWKRVSEEKAEAQKGGIDDSSDYGSFGIADA
jgi:hypothetical protein